VTAVTAFRVRERAAVLADGIAERYGLDAAARDSLAAAFERAADEAMAATATEIVRSLEFRGGPS
jgi:hypothetical protein